MRILILGVSGMLGSAVFRELSKNAQYEVFGTARSHSVKNYFNASLSSKIIFGVDILDADSLNKVLGDVKPKVVINCIGLVKQLSDSKDPLVALPLNSLFPHKLAALCRLMDARLVHISTDCVFLGDKGNYKESDPSDADDVYGKSKYLGELNNDKHAVTLRTSIIGHELNSNRSLVDWFLSQDKEVKGFKKAIFSGLPTVELAHVIEKYVLPNPELHGLYHVSSAAINKFDLLSLVAETYGKKINITPDEKLKIDRSLDSSRFQASTGYKPPEWSKLVSKMFEDFKTRSRG